METITNNDDDLEIPKERKWVFIIMIYVPISLYIYSSNNVFN